MMSWRGIRRKRDVHVSATGVDVDAPSDTVSEGSLKFTFEQGGNNSDPSYQEASGAPVERRSPLGYSAGPIAIIMLNLSKMVGTGIYSTPSSVLSGTGSVGLSLIFWALGFFISLASLAVYLEYAAYFPNRSGSEVVYLEQAFPRPKYFFPTTFAVQTVVLSFSSSNAIVLAEYLFRVHGSSPSPWQLKGVAIGGYTVAFLLVVFHTRSSYWVSNGIGIVKLLTLIFVAITGLVVLGGNVHRVPDPTANFRDAFAGTLNSGYGPTNALYKIVFSYSGYENAFNVVNEVKNPVKTIRNNATIALLTVSVLYVLANIAYFAAVPKEELMESSQVAASLFFEKVFGSSGAARGLSFLIALSAFGNLVAVLIGQSRMIRECGRFWASTKPFGTPFGPYFVKWALTLLMILAPPAGDAFNFAFLFIMAVGLYLVRYRRKKLGVGRSSFRAWDVALIFTIIVNLYLLVMPWYPPSDGADGGDVSFWYATYAATGVGILVFCAVYYWVWVYVLPRFGHYRMRQEAVILGEDSVTHRLVKVPNDKLTEWDETHDAVGRELRSNAINSDTILTDPEK
ncbi:MAG: hypothetical protein Q9157_007551 [Trypethelium eluteriae]